MRYLVILEVSRKQNYIFSSNRLKENIQRSAQIAYITSPAFFENTAGAEGLYQEENYVYSGGGHTVLEFSTDQEAVSFVRLVTTCAYTAYPLMELFAAVHRYDDTLSPVRNMELLTEKLERKKAERRSSFHQGSFGVEKIDSTTLEPIRLLRGHEDEDPYEGDITTREKKIDDTLIPDGYKAVSQFEELGTSKGSSSFIAVVHIDGNGMGKRVAAFYKEHETDSWEDFKKAIRMFSDCIDEDYKTAFKAMNLEVAKQLKGTAGKKLDLKENAFPIRRIITSGDDVCFVSEGRIGIEAAVCYIKELSKLKNKLDTKGYPSCAGVALVHQKYPFFRAYELAELLCSNAKRFGAGLGSSTGLADGGSSICSIDWHIERGEIGDSIEEIRRDYRTEDGASLELRPLLILAGEEISSAEPIRRYDAVKRLLELIKQKGDDDIRSKLKEMRSAMKQGEAAVDYYIRFHKLEEVTVNTYQDIFCQMDLSKIGSGEGLEGRSFVRTNDGMLRNLLYDAVEIMDTYIPFETD